MKKNKYSSFNHIESDLGILKLEKEISKRKLVSKYNLLKDKYLPSSEHKDFSFISLVTKIPFRAYASVFKFTLPFIFEWFLNKKRD